MPLWQICKNFELVIQRIKQAISVLLLLFYVFSFGELIGVKFPYLVPYKYHKLVEYEIPYNVLYEIKVIKIKEEETKAQQTPQIYELFDRRVTENELEEIIEEIVQESHDFNFSEEEKDLLARLIKLEAGDQSWECQCAVGSVVLNRLKQEYGGKKTLHGVIYARGQFSTAHRIKRTKATQTQKDVVEYLLQNGVTLPEDVIYFHYKRYGKWGTPYCCIGTEYFSRG